MIVRPLTFITGLMFVLSGAYLFAVKHESNVLNDKLAQLVQATRQDEQSTRVLQAQWALEADPSRLAALAAQFTTLKPMQPKQLTTLAALGSDLPAPGSPVPGINPADPDAVLPQIAAAHPETPMGAQVAEAAARMMPPPPPAAPPAPPRRVAERLPAPPPPTPPRHEAVSHIYMARAQTEQALPPPPPSRPEHPMGARVVRVRALAAATPPAPVQATAGGSLLGMAQEGRGN